MRKSYTQGLPFGVHRQSGRLMSITEVERGINCNCLCPCCKTELVAKQGDVKMWHFSHSTDVLGDCDGLMIAIRSKIIEIIKGRSLLSFPHLLEAYDGGPVPLDEIKEHVSMFGAIADLEVTVNQLRVGVYLDSDRSISTRLSFGHVHEQEPVAALRIDLLDVEFEIGRVQRGERQCSYSECLEQIITGETGSREWLYHPMQHQVEKSELKRYYGRQPSEAGPLLQRLADKRIKVPAELPSSMNAIYEQRQSSIVSLCSLTVKGSEIAQTDEFPLFLRYFRHHCLDDSENVSYEALMRWIELISQSREGQALTEEEIAYLKEVEWIARYNHRLKGASPKEHNMYSSKVHQSSDPAGGENYTLI